jgi:hypothetical protein
LGRVSGMVFIVDQLASGQTLDRRVSSQAGPDEDDPGAGDGDMLARCEVTMPSLFRGQPTLRLLIGATIALFVWTLYVLRVTLDIGPMHDYQGNQAPAFHYLVGAFVVTGMVAVWIIARAAMTRNHRRR